MGEGCGGGGFDGEEGVMMVYVAVRAGADMMDEEVDRGEWS